MKRRRVIIVILIIVVVAAIYFLFRKRSSSSAADSMQGPMPVQVAAPEIRDVMTYNEFTGNLAAVESVDIRARVQGYLRHVAFRDGTFVNKGDLLFEIEPEAFQARRRSVAHKRFLQLPFRE